MTQDTGIKILIIGKDGMLGHKIYEVLKNKFKYVYATSKTRKKKKNKFVYNNINIKNKKKVFNLIKKIKPHYLINCTGIIKQKLSRIKNYDLYLINSFFPIELNKLSKAQNFKNIHFSTDCVFNGKKGNYSEKDKTNASDQYGRSKYIPEKKIKKSSLIIRTSIIGHEKNYSQKSLLNWFLGQSKKCLGFSNAFFTGVTTLELSEIILYIIKKKKFSPGLFNLSGKKISKYELLKLIKNIYQKKIEIIKNTSFKIDRSLNGNKFNKKFGIKVKSWNNQIKLLHNDYKKMKKKNNYL